MFFRKWQYEILQGGKAGGRVNSIMEKALEAQRGELCSTEAKGVLPGQHLLELDGVRAISIWMALIGHLYRGSRFR